jgi:hypothetical protein
MRCQLVVCALWLAGLTGCPHDLAKAEDFFDRSATKDTQESLHRPECTEQVHKALCPEGEPRSKECIKVCGE